MTTPPAAPLGPQPDDLDNLFSYHPPRPDQVPRFEALRAAGREFAEAIFDHVPASPERSLAIGKVREAVMWANAGIACREPEPPVSVATGVGHAVMADQHPETAPGVGATDPPGVGSPAPVDEGPHARACGPTAHQHGTACHPNCPTCGGKA